MVVKQNYQKYMDDLMSDKIRYEKVFSVFINDLGRNWYDDFGRFIINSISNDEPIPLHFYYNLGIPASKLGVKRKNITIPTNVRYSSIGIESIHFLSKECLREFLGRPLFHNHFGEGLTPSSKSSYASYFVQIDGVDFHIGYDHRGTEIEVKYGTSPDILLDKLKSFYTEIWKYLIYQYQ